MISKELRESKFDRFKTGYIDESVTIPSYWSIPSTLAGGHLSDSFRKGCYM